MSLIVAGTEKFVDGRGNKLYCKPQVELISDYRAAHGFVYNFIEFLNV